jgi:hypothetical protein
MLDERRPKIEIALNLHGSHALAVEPEETHHPIELFIDESLRARELPRTPDFHGSAINRPASQAIDIDHDLWRSIHPNPPGILSPISGTGWDPLKSQKGDNRKRGNAHRFSAA